jgi:hypothetical protein
MFTVFMVFMVFTREHEQGIPRPPAAAKSVDIKSA